MFILLKITNNKAIIIKSAISPDFNQTFEHAIKRIEKFVFRTLTDDERAIFEKTKVYENISGDLVTFQILDTRI